MSKNNLLNSDSIKDLWQDIEQGLKKSKMNPRMISLLKQSYFSGCMGTIMLIIDYPKSVDMNEQTFHEHVAKLTHEIEQQINQIESEIDFKNNKVH